MLPRGRARLADRLKRYMALVGASSADDALARAHFVAQTMEALRAVEPVAIGEMRREADELSDIDAEPVG